MTTFGPYSPIHSAGNLVFISGQVGVDQDTHVTAPSAAEQTAQALENMKRLLAGRGMGLRSIAKTTVFLTNMDDFDAMNTVYAQYFPDPSPARSTVCVKELPRVGGDVPIVVEIEAVAHKELL